MPIAEMRMEGGVRRAELTEKIKVKKTVDGVEKEVEEVAVRGKENVRHWKRLYIILGG